MGRIRKKKPAAKSTVRRAGLAWSGSFSIVAIDEGPLRTGVLSEYHHVEVQLSTAREELENFETGDRPAFLRWELSKFGLLLTQIRDLTAAVAEKDRILDAVDQEAYWSRCSETTAYRRVMEARHRSDAHSEEEDLDDEAEAECESGNPSESDEAPSVDERGRPYVFGTSHLPPDFDIDDFDRSSKTVKKQFREFYGDFTDLYEIFTGCEAPRLDDLLDEARGKKHGGAASEGSSSAEEATGNRRREQQRPAKPADLAAEHLEARIKEIYRRLVRQLHPDLNRKQTARERELWHEMQAAYRDRDLERLEAVSGRLEVGLNGASSSLPVQIILRMVRDLRDALKGLRGALNTARKSPAWNFRTKAADLVKYEAKRRQQLESEHAKLTQQLAYRTMELADLETRSKRSAPRQAQKAKAKPAARKRSPAAPQGEFSF